MSLLKLTKIAAAAVGSVEADKIGIFSDLDDQGTPKYKDENGSIFSFSNPFGSEFQYFENTADETNNSSTWDTYLSCVTTDLPLGDYFYIIEYYWNHSSGSTDFGGRLQLNDVTNGDIHRQEPKDGGGEQRFVNHFFRRFTGLSGVNTINFQYNAANNSNTSRIYEARAILFRIV